MTVQGGVGVHDAYGAGPAQNAGASGAQPERAAVLVFAGVDPSGGAGIAADLQAIAGQGAHALTVVTALTAQDNDRVYDVQPVEPALLLRQASALTEKIRIAAVKVGIPGSAANARAIAEVVLALRRGQPGLPLIVDPVLASGHGDTLSRGDAVSALAPLLALATVLTPNGPEALVLSGRQEPSDQARVLRAKGCRHVLITGGHDGGEQVLNRYFGPDASREWRWPRLPGGFHGSGCTLASAIAGLLAQGVALEQALDQAQAYVHRALQNSYAVADGQRMPLR